MKRLSLVLSLITAHWLLLTSSSAQIPQLINYQGRLINGTNLFNGQVAMTLRLYTNATSGFFYFEDSNTVNVVDGLYSTFIGDDATFPSSLATALAYPEVYVEVEVNGVKLSPRERIASVAYAQFAAGVSDGAITASKIAAGAVTSSAIATASITSNKIDWSTMPAPVDGSAYVAKAGDTMTGTLTINSGGSSKLLIDTAGSSIGIGSSANGDSSGVAVGNSANGNNGVSIGNAARGDAEGTAVGKGARGDIKGVAVGYAAFSQDSGVALGYMATSFANGVAAGFYAYAPNGGVALGDHASGENGAAVGAGANGKNNGAAVGPNAIAYGYGSAVGYNAGGASNGAAVGYYANAYDHGAALGSSATAYSNGVAIGNSATGFALGVAIGERAQGSDNGVGIGFLANGSPYGAAVGTHAIASDNGAALGNSANGNSYGVGIGFYAIGDNNGAAVGRSANGENDGAAVGKDTKGNNYGAAIGEGSDGSGSGAAVGNGATGSVSGVAVGSLARGNVSGVAIGVGANGYSECVAVGAYANAGAPVHAVALGYSVTNNVSDSARVRGTLYLDGGTGVVYRATFGSGAWAAKAFTIDHPLDPQNKVLRHFCVEGPVVWNVYAGTAALDAKGEATVELPAYFGKLNINPQYLLTPVGAQMNLFVKQEIANNRFVIGGGTPGGKACWEIKAQRNDPAAVEDLKNRPVEQLKSELKPGQMAAEAASINTDSTSSK